MEKKIIYLVRHGETDYNKMGIVQGSGADIPLNSRGVAQAHAFYNFYKHVPFKIIFTSALVRTQQSVLPFIEAGFSYKIIPELNEISWGVLEGKMQTAEHKAMYWDVVNQWKNQNYNAKLNGGESAMELYNRMSVAAYKIFNKDLPQTSLICMHGRAMKAFLCFLLQQPLSNMDYFEHSNLCLYVLEMDEHNNFTLIKQNSIEHFNSFIA